MGDWSAHGHTRTLMWSYASVVALLLIGLVGVHVVRQDREAVLNPSAVRNLSDWRARAQTGELPMVRVRVPDGPAGLGTAVDVQRTGTKAGYAFVVSGLRSPQHFFQKGRVYRMRAWVRDLNASGASAGLLLANSNFAHRPTRASQYLGFRDRSWHLMQRTFTASGKGYADTKLYVQLPSAARLHWQLTGLSVRPAVTPRLRTTSSGPSRVLAFDGPAGSSPTRSVWSHESGSGGWGNGELQAYTVKTANSHVDGHGHLIITTRRERAVGGRVSRTVYTSARLTTQGKFAVQPGSYVEATIAAPVGERVRPAFWTLGTDIEQVGWPACGELDVMESTRQGRNTVRQAVHMSRVGHPSRDAAYGEFAPGGYTKIDGGLRGEAHRYGVFFDANMVAFFVDGQQRLTMTRTQAFETGRTWPFDRPQSLLLSIAVVERGDMTQFPVSMSVSAIRIWSDGVPLSVGSVLAPRA